MEGLFEDGGSGSPPDIKRFDLYGHDYLQFAEYELEQYNSTSDEQRRTSHLINCLSNLKRALENQLDLFVHAFRLNQLYASMPMNVPNKLKLVERCGILEGRTFVRINRMRNIVEHEYEIPAVEDIEAFYDLVSTAVSLLQQGLLLTFNSNADFQVYEGDDNIGGFCIGYNIEESRAIVNWNTPSGTQKLVFDSSAPDDIVFVLRILFFLRQLNVSASTRYIRSKLGLA